MSERTIKGRKYRILADSVERIWDKISFWTHADDVEFNDGRTAQQKVGGINGISDQYTSATSSDIALSVKGGNTLNANLLQSMDTMKVYVNSEEKLVWRDKDGADTVLNFNNKYHWDGAKTFSVTTPTQYSSTSKIFAVSTYGINTLELNYWTGAGHTAGFKIKYGGVRDDGTIDVSNYDAMAFELTCTGRENPGFIQEGTTYCELTIID